MFEQQFTGARSQKMNLQTRECLIGSLFRFFSCFKPFFCSFDLSENLSVLSLYLEMLLRAIAGQVWAGCWHLQ